MKKRFPKSKGISFYCLCEIGFGFLVLSLLLTIIFLKKNRFRFMKYFANALMLSILFLSCSEDEVQVIPEDKREVPQQLFEDYDLLPEMMVAIDPDSTTFAQYAQPTEKYRHGILGDRIEAEQLVVIQDGVLYDLTLDNPYVFEDIRPRIFDVDNDNNPEYITIRTHVERGGAIAIYKVINGQLTELTSIEEIGIPNRWLNIAAIDDLDNDGTVEIAWVETPHIGGILKVASIENNRIIIKDEIREYSNHAIGEINLCLSVLTDESSFKGLYVPNQTRDSIIGFLFQNDNWSIFNRIAFDVEFSLPLEDQYQFDNLFDQDGNCIY